MLFCSEVLLQAMRSFLKKNFRAALGLQLPRTHTHAHTHANLQDHSEGVQMLPVVHHHDSTHGESFQSVHRLQYGTLKTLRVAVEMQQE